MLNVVCVKTGKAYSNDYVYNLESALKRHLHIPFQFWCLTDDETLNVKRITPDEQLMGWWGKMYTFSDLMPEGDLLVLDIDQLIVGDITEIVTEALKHPFSCFGDHISWEGERLGTSFMTFKSDSLVPIFQQFWEHRHELVDYQGGDQVWVSRSGLLPDVCYLEDKFPDAFVSYKWGFLKTGLKEVTRILNFHGLPKQHQLSKTKLVQEHWR